MTAQHSSKTDEHYTPAGIVDAARRAVGGHIDLDPASSALANETVRASSFFVRNDNGLNESWAGRVFLNPPGGKLANASSQKVWFCKLLCEYVAGRVTSAVFVGFSLEILQTAQRLPFDLPTPLELPCCIPRARMAFDTPMDGRRVKGASPTHANVIVFLPAMTDQVVSSQRFVDAFSEFGQVIVPAGGLLQFQVDASAAKVRDALDRSGVGQLSMTQDLLLSSLLASGASMRRRDAASQ